MPRILNVSLALVLAIGSQACMGDIVDPCTYVGGAAHLPSYPGPNDPIGYTLEVPTFTGSQILPQYQHYWVKQTQTAVDTFAVDAIVTNAATSFPGYVPVNPRDQNWGFIGPLPPGSYTILGTVSVFDPSVGMHSVCDPSRPAVQYSTSVRVFSIDEPFYQNLRAAQAPVLELYDRANDDYFMTMDRSEFIAAQMGSTRWFPTGYQFYAFVRDFFNGFGGTNVQRFYGLPSPGLDTHLFTLDANEVAALSANWTLENISAFEIWQPLTATGFCPKNTLPVYRLWNGKGNAHHRYTIEPAVRQEMIAKGWIPEGYGPDGVVMCSPAM